MLALPALVLVVMATCCSTFAQTNTLIISGSANIWGAGHASVSSGVLPPGVTFTALPGKVLTFSSVIGAVDFNAGAGLEGPDDTPLAVAWSLPSSQGISGIADAYHAGNVWGVFLDDSEPQDPAPPTLDFGMIGHGFAMLQPQLRQVFFVGDGLTGHGNGNKHHFIVPPGATRLYLGTPDSLYGDNSGSFTATFEIKQGTVNDLSADWSDTQNPNGVWSYNEGLHPLPHSDCAFRNCSPWTGCLPAWNRGETCPTQGGSSPVIPSWAKVPEPTVCDMTNFYDIQVGDIFMHSWSPVNGDGNGEANVTWRANANGTVNAMGNIWDCAKFLGRGNHWSIHHNNTLLTEGEVSSSDSYTRAAPFDFQMGTGGSNVLQNVRVNASDLIRLTIVRTTTHGTASGVNFTLAFTPEPTNGPRLKIQLHPGLLLYGTTGTTYRVEYVAQSGDTNWTTLTNLVLPSSPYLIFDPQPATSPARFYRTVELP